MKWCLFFEIVSFVDDYTVKLVKEKCDEDVVFSTFLRIVRECYKVIGR